MRYSILPLLLVLAACSDSAAPAGENAVADHDAAAANVEILDDGAWSADAASASIAFAEGGEMVVRLSCPAGERLRVDVPGFNPVASEERMTLGAGEIVTTLVADPAGDVLTGGVSGEAPVPNELAAIIGAHTGPRVNYGSQNSPPLPPVPGEIAGALLSGCTAAEADQASAG